MQQTIATYIVDSFTEQPFKGNPAGVCLLDKPLLEPQMLTIAKELGFSETAFVQEIESPNKFYIRFFSPKMEIPLCGHATLAAAKVLFEQSTVRNNIHFKNIQHLDLHIKKEEDWIVMEFPVYGTIPQNAPLAILEALGIKEVNNSVFNVETNILMLEIEDSDLLSQLTPNFEQLKKAHNTINGVLITAASKQETYDFESRYFWPWSGTNEDPVTGGTHTFLAKYWSKRLNKKKLYSFQSSERTGFMKVELIDDQKMNIKGKAQIILQGLLNL